MDLVQALQNVTKGELEPGRIVTFGGIIFGIMSQGRFTISYPDGRMEIWGKIAPPTLSVCDRGSLATPG
jgi:hypothetical protein